MTMNQGAFDTYISRFTILSSGARYEVDVCGRAFALKTFAVETRLCGPVRRDHIEVCLGPTVCGY